MIRQSHRSLRNSSPPQRKRKFDKEKEIKFFVIVLCLCHDSLIHYAVSMIQYYMLCCYDTLCHSTLCHDSLMSISPCVVMIHDSLVHIVHGVMIQSTSL